MTPPSSIFLFSLLALLALLAATPARSEQPSAASQVMQSALPPELASMFPVGREFKGVAIPSYSGERLQSVMRSKTIVRIDERFLDLTNLVISIYNGKGEPDTTIEMDEAVYDLNLGELRSKTPSKIEQSQFVMTGDSMIFESKSRITRLEGNVRVIIPDADQLSPSLGLP